MEIHVEIKMSNQELSKELELRWFVEEFIMKQGIGEVVDAGTGPDVMDIFVDVNEASVAINSLEKFVKKHSLQDRVTLQVLNG
jgi:hypothetical protein